MAIKVAAIGTGNVGRHALTQLITDPRFELTGGLGVRRLQGGQGRRRACGT